jgi:hypothetical protein
MLFDEMYVVNSESAERARSRVRLHAHWTLKGGGRITAEQLAKHAGEGAEHGVFLIRRCKRELCPTLNAMVQHASRSSS